MSPETSIDELAQIFETVSSYFALLAEPMRVRILHAICNEEKTVNQIVAETGATQTNVSRHLNNMYRAGALTRRKDGNFVFYGVADRALTDLCRTVCTHIAARSEGAEVSRRDLLGVARAMGRSESNASEVFEGSGSGSAGRQRRGAGAGAGSGRNQKGRKSA